MAVAVGDEFDSVGLEEAARTHAIRQLIAVDAKLYQAFNRAARDTHCRLSRLK